MTLASPTSGAALWPVLLPRIDFAGRFAAVRNVPFHAHAGAELVLVTKGACQIEIRSEGARLSGCSGTLFVLPANIPHNQRTLQFTRTSFVVFHARPAQFDAAARIVPIPEGDPIHAWMDQICDLATEDDHADGQVAGAVLFACLERLQALEHRDRLRHALPTGLSRLIEQLERQAAEPFRADAVARRAGLSVSHMNLLFRRHLGCSPLRYLQERRLHRARALLRGTYARVNEVAAVCGYEDANYFIRLFTRQFGVSPGVWQKKAGLEQEIV